MLVDGSNWAENASQFNKNFIKNHNEDSGKGYFLEIDLHNDLLFLPEQIKFEKVEKLVANLHNKKEFFILHIRNLNKH